MLTQREKLGFDWEVKTQLFLENLAIPFSGNPQDPSDWKRKGCGDNKPKQHRPDIETQTQQIECKFVGHAFYQSYVEGNVFPRFKDNGKKKVVITNDKTLWFQKAREILAEHNIELWTLADLKEYFSNPTFTSIYNYIKKGYGNCTGVVTHAILYLVNITLNLIRNTLNSILRAVFETKRLLLSNSFGQKKNDTLNLKTESNKRDNTHDLYNLPISFGFSGRQTRTAYTHNIPFHHWNLPNQSRQRPLLQNHKPRLRKWKTT